MTEVERVFIVQLVERNAQLTKIAARIGDEVFVLARRLRAACPVCQGVGAVQVNRRTNENTIAVSFDVCPSCQWVREVLDTPHCGARP